MASPIATGGAGVHLESRIAAYYLASVLIGGAVRGLPRGVTAQKVTLQRAALGQPLDDVIVHGQSAGGPSTLSLQMKRTFTFGESELFLEVMAECWKTFTKADFRRGFDRFGLAVGTPDPGVEKAGRSVLRWARESADAADFLTRMGIENFASAAMRDFLAHVRAALVAAKGGPVTDEDLWLFLRHLVALYFDIEAADNSHNLVEVTDRLSFALPNEDADRAGDLWLALVDIADSAKPAAGSLDRAALVSHLQPAFTLAPARNIQPDLDALQDVAGRSLDDIRTDIGGVHLPRTALREQLGDMAGRVSTVELAGEAGTGKSALAKALLSDRLDEGPVLVLTAKRLPSGAPGWEGLARHWGLSRPLDELIAELSCVASPCLLVDGIDRIEDQGTWLAVNDIFRAVRRSASADRWTFIFTARTNSLDYRTKLDAVVTAVPPERLPVGDLDDDDIAEVAVAHPAIAPLVAKDGPAHQLAARPYLLSRLIRTGPASFPHGAPVTEVDLMLQLWEGAGPGEDLSEAQILARQDVLVELGRRRLAAPGKALTSLGLSHEALVSLRKDDILEHDRATRTVAFSHDMIEDWVLCQALNHAEGTLAEAIERAGQPLWLVDAVQLLAQWRLERGGTPAEWSALIAELSQEPLEPRWRRATLTAPLQSTRGAELLARMEPALWENDGALLADMMVAMRTVEVDPNPFYLTHPQLDEDARVYGANRYPLPRRRSWTPFFSWLVAKLESLPPHLLEGASEVLAVVGQAFTGIPRRAAPTIAAWASRWLDHINPQGDHWRDTFHVRYERLSAMNLGDERAFENRLLEILLRCAAGAPDVVVGYLHAVKDARRQAGPQFVVEHANWVADHLPAEIVDFLLHVMRSEEEDRYRSYRDLNRLGIEHDRLFFPASHLRPPFLTLLKRNPTEGLRLVNGLCNHAMVRWRTILSEDRRCTPLPLRIRFPWGEKEFWGHAREYRWNRGIGPGPYAVMSALMALEVWIEERVAAGDTPEDVFRQALEGNDCVGALGACVAAAMAYPDECLRAALPFACSPQLCHWDIQRSVQDGRRGLHLIWSAKDRPFLEEVIKRTERPHRRQHFRDEIITRLVFGPNELRQAFTNCLEDLLTTGNLPFDFQEQASDPARVGELEEQIRRLIALADRKNWAASATDVPGEVRLQYVPPAEIAPDPELAREQAELERTTRIAHWAERSIEEGQTHDSVGLDEAFAIALDLDAPDLFEDRPPLSDFLRYVRVGAVSGAAAVLAKHAADDGPELAWGRNVLLRASTSPLDNDPMLFEQSATMFHPSVNAAAGLSYLVERGLATDEEKEALLCLLCHPLVKAKAVIAKNLARSWDREPLVCWQALALSLKLSLEPRSIIEEHCDGYGFRMSRARVRWLVRAAIAALRGFRKATPSRLSRIPAPWVRDESSNANEDEADGYRPSDAAFLWHIVPEAVLPMVNASAMSDPDRREALLVLIADLMAWTVMEAAPPWGEDHTPAFEWMHSFMMWCAQLTTCLSDEEIERLLLSPIASIVATDGGEYLLRDFILGVVTHRLRQNDSPDERMVRLWNRLLDLVADHPKAERHARESGGITFGYGQCVALMIFSHGRALVDHPWPGLEAFRPAIQRWVDRFANAQSYYRQLMSFLSGGGYGLAPEPALGWLARVVEDHKADKEFWTGNGNGDETAQLLARILDDHAQLIRASKPLLRQMARMTDILVSHGVRVAAQVQQRLAIL